MKTYRNVTIFNDELKNMLAYLKKSNKNPTIIISSLNIPKVRVNNVLDKMLYHLYIEDLKVLLEICTQSTHIYIFSESYNLGRNIKHMENIGFKLRNILSYKVNWKHNKEEKLYEDNLNYVLFFTIGNIKEKDRKLSVRRQTNLLFDRVIEANKKDYPKVIIERLIKNSMLSNIDENIIIDIGNKTGNVADYCLRNNLKCFTYGKDNIIHLRLTKTLKMLDNYKKDNENNIQLDNKEKKKNEIRKLFKK